VCTFVVVQLCGCRKGEKKAERASIDLRNLIMCDIQPRAGALPNNLRFLQTNEQIDDCKDIQVQFDSRGAVHKVKRHKLGYLYVRVVLHNLNT
jgi:hypothetical protein